MTSAYDREDFILPERIPPVEPLTIDEFQLLSQAGLGLRTTSPNLVEDEVKNGVFGDYIILSDLDGFLRIKEDAAPGLNEFQRELMVKAALLDQPNNAGVGLNDLEGLDTLPHRYQESLHRFFLKKAIPTFGPPIGRDVTVSQLLNTSASPELLLVSDDKRGGYDNDLYYGFNKKGRHQIQPGDIITQTGLTDEDYTLLRRRYGPYLDQPVHRSGLISSKPTMILGQSLDTDISTLLVGKTLKAIRSNIQK